MRFFISIVTVTLFVNLICSLEAKHPHLNKEEPLLQSELSESSSSWSSESSDPSWSESSESSDPSWSESSESSDPSWSESSESSDSSSSESSDDAFEEWSNDVNVQVVYAPQRNNE